MTKTEFKASRHSMILKEFLATSTGTEMMDILRTFSEPKKSDVKVASSGQDLVMQLALAGQYRVAQHEIVGEIRELSQGDENALKPPIKPEDGPDLEPEIDEPSKAKV